MVRLDDVDVKILLAMIADPRIQISDLADQVGIARNTAQSRMRRLLAGGVLRNGGRDIDLAGLGYDVLAFVTLEVMHRDIDAVICALHEIPNILEVHEISGNGDVWLRLAAADTHQLQGALRRILRISGVNRSETTFALHTHMSYRTAPLLEQHRHELV